MKRALLVLTVLATIATSAVAQGSSPSFAFTAAVTPRVGLLSNGSADVGVAGTGLEIGAAFIAGNWIAEAGFEAGTGSVGWQVFFPLRAGLRFGRQALGAEIMVEAGPGLALTKPALFMAGLGAGARITLRVTPGWELFAGAGIRLTLCPDYGAFTGSGYEMLDAPLSLGVRWTVGGR